MKRDWIKLDVRMLDDPRYGTLTDDLWRLVIQLNLLAGEVDRDGLLPAVRDMAWELHMGTGTLQISLHHLSERGLVHSTPQGWVVTDFKESQAAPNSTERSRAFRKRRKSAMQEENESNDDTGQDSARCTGQDSAPCATRQKTYGASEMQPSRHLPVSKPVPNPVSDPGQPGRPGKGRRRHKIKGQPVDTYPVDTCPVDTYPVDKPVENFVEKGRKISDSSTSTSSTSSLIKYLKSSLKIKLPLLELLGQKPESEKFRPSQAKTPKNKRGASESALFAARPDALPGRKQTRTDSDRAPQTSLQEPVDTYPVDTYPVDKSVDNSVEKGRKNSDPDDIPP
jgi:DNA-binding transcriptional regulator YhcF (GntR family)